MRRPKIKDEHLPYRTPGGPIRIGGGLYGLAAEIQDPHGWIWAALAMMDGTRAPDEIARTLRERFPELTAETSRQLVKQLTATGYVEDAANRAPQELTPLEVTRYERNQAFFRMVDLRRGRGGWDAQLSLKRARVLVLGVGGTGSHAAWALVAAGVGRVHCVDRDLVELSNLTRQILYTQADLRRPKALVAAERLGALNSEVEVTGEQRTVGSRDALEELVAGFDVLALCADEPDSEVLRQWASEMCVRTGVPWVGGGYSGPLVSVGVFTAEGPCFQCLAAGEEARLPGLKPPPLGGKGVIAPSAGISGNLVAYEIIALLTGIQRDQPGYLRGINLIAPDDLVFARHPARPNCPNCHG